MSDQKKGYLLQERVSRHVGPTFDKNVENRGITIDLDTAKKWKESKTERDYVVLPLYRAVERTVFDFEEL